MSCPKWCPKLLAASRARTAHETHQEATGLNTELVFMAALRIVGAVFVSTAMFGGRGKGERTGGGVRVNEVWEEKEGKEWEGSRGWEEGGCEECGGEWGVLTGHWTVGGSCRRERGWEEESCVMWLVVVCEGEGAGGGGGSSKCGCAEPCCCCG